MTVIEVVPLMSIQYPTPGVGFLVLVFALFAGLVLLPRFRDCDDDDGG